MKNAKLTVENFVIFSAIVSQDLELSELAFCRSVNAVKVYWYKNCLIFE